MQSELETVVRDDGDTRVLDARGLVTHYTHISGEGARRSPGCRYCAKGPAGFTNPVKGFGVVKPVGKGSDDVLPSPWGQQAKTQGAANGYHPSRHLRKTTLPFPLPYL